MEAKNDLFQILKTGQFKIERNNNGRLVKRLIRYVSTNGLRCPDLVILKDGSCHKIKKFDTSRTLMIGICMFTHSDDYWFIHISDICNTSCIKPRFKKEIVDYYGIFTFIWMPSCLQVYELFVELDLFDEINLIDIILSFLSFKQ